MIDYYLIAEYLLLKLILILTVCAFLSVERSLFSLLYIQDHSYLEIQLIIIFHVLLNNLLILPKSSICIAFILLKTFILATILFFLDNHYFLQEVLKVRFS